MTLSRLQKTWTLAVGLSVVLAAGALAASHVVPPPLPNPNRAAASSGISLPERNPTRLTRRSEEPGVMQVAAAPSFNESADALAETARVTTFEGAVAEAPALPYEGPPPPERAPEPLAPPFDFAKALKPLLDYELTAADSANLKEVFRAAYAGRSTDAAAAASVIKDKSARMLAEWYYLRGDGTTAAPERIETFRLANPGWPSPDLLRRRAEEALLARGTAQSVKDFFAKSPPATPAGKVALAAAHLEDGERAKAAALIRFAWIDPDLDGDVEKRILDKHADLLTQEDQKARIDVLFYQDERDKLDDALRLAALLGDGEKKKAEARAAVVRRVKKAEKLLDALPEEAKTEIGVRFSRIQWLRRHDRDKEAWELLRAAPSDPAVILDLDEWWIERRINTRAALTAGEPQIAYEIAKNHGPLTGESYAEAEFLAGWIALRYLDQPETAKTHFVALRTAASGSKTISRAEYWLGRTEQALDNAVGANAHFRNAAQYPFDYYGQLAAHAALHSNGPVALAVAPTPLPTEADVARLLSHDAVRAIGILRAADLDGIVPLFFFELARTLDSPAEVVLLAELARRMDRLQTSVRLSKIALNRGLPVVDYAFPTDVLPYYKQLNDGVETSLLHALSRQESEFNADAKSPAGAHGLLQLMPRTARSVAKSYKVRYSLARLTKEPDFNMMLGDAHLRDLVDEFGGSYAMALAAYNAGGPRVQKWIGDFGNPCHTETDPIDWVERIPFTETRDYVQKILESLQVFRARLEGPERALRIHADLHRGRPSPAAPETASIDEPASPQ